MWYIIGDKMWYIIGYIVLIVMSLMIIYALPDGFGSRVEIDKDYYTKKFQEWLKSFPLLMYTGILLLVVLCPIALIIILIQETYHEIRELIGKK